MIYYILFSISFLKKRLLFFVFFCFFLFGALRFDVGYDFAAYYASIVNDSFEELTLRYGHLHANLMILSRLSHPQIYFVISYFITLVPIFFVYKKLSPVTWVAVAAFISFPFLFLTSLVYIRQYIAISFSLLALYFLICGKAKLFVCALVFSLINHFTAVVTIMFVLVKISVSRYFYLLFLPLFLYSDSILLHFIEISPYAQYIIDVSGGTLMKFLLLILLILFWFYLGRNFIFDKLFLIYYIGVFLFFAAQPFGFVALRISYYFLIILPVLLSYVFVFSRLSKSILYPVLIVLFLFVYSFSLYLSSKEGLRSQYLPYQFYWGSDINDLRPY